MIVLLITIAKHSLINRSDLETTKDSNWNFCIHIRNLIKVEIRARWIMQAHPRSELNNCDWEASVCVSISTYLPHPPININAKNTCWAESFSFNLNFAFATFMLIEWA